MKLLLKAFRNGFGALIALVSRLIPLKKLKEMRKHKHWLTKKHQKLNCINFFLAHFAL